MNLVKRQISLWFHNPLTRYIQNPEGTAWQQAVLLLHNDGFWDIMGIGFCMYGAIGDEKNIYIKF